MSYRFIAVVAGLLLAACTQKPRPAWPNEKPDVDTVKLKAGVEQVSPQVANQAVVLADRLKFPLAMADQVRAEWPAGKVVLSQPAADMAARKTNPFGFMRKVKAVNVVGGEVVVETEPALLEEVLDGQFHKTIDLDTAETFVLPADTDLSAFDVPLDLEESATPFPVIRGEAAQQSQPLLGDAPGDGLMLFGKRRQALTANGPTFDVPKTEIPFFDEQFAMVAPSNPSAKLNFNARLSVTPTFELKPSLVLDYDWNELKFRMESFEFKVGVEGKVGLTADVFVATLPNAQLSLNDRQSILTQLQAGPKRIPLKKQPIGKPVFRYFQLGPVPIVMKAEAFLKCTLAIKGPTRVRGTMLAQFSPKVGVEYSHGDGWSPTLDSPIPNITASVETPDNRADVEVECGLIGRVDLLAADKAGPWAQVRRALVLDAKRSEVCEAERPASYQATQRTDLALRMYDDFTVGFQIQLLKKDFGTGPYELARQNYDETSGPPYTPNPHHVEGLWWTGPAQWPTVTWTPIWKSRKDVPDVGVTRCMVTCEDQQKSAGETDVDCGGPTCFKCKKGKTCAVDGDCASGQCLSTKTCSGSPCDDDVKGQQESDVDCGGPSCAKCAAGKTCAAGSDCSSGVCGDNGRCVASKCEDGVKGQQETDVDCGGPSCRPCALNSPCALDRDCAQGFCSRVGAPVCTDNLCRDGQRSGTESDVDCGLSEGCTQLCALGQRCVGDGDCASNACNLATHQCVATACVDGRQDRGETDVDCGGPCQTKCALGQGCHFAANVDADCQSGVCASTNVCVATICENKRKDPGEVGTDCAGSCTARCPVLETCNATPDCVSGTGCHPNRRRCELPGCDDGLKNGQESSIDCGGPNCSKCAIAKACSVDTDCVTNLCDHGRCISSVCENGVKDATEADVDCGGTSCGALKCGLGKSCGGNADCASNICAAGTCTSDPCRDRVRNGGETDVDCGGASCTSRCERGKSCNAGSDCASGQCNGTTHVCIGSMCEDGVRNGGETDVDCGGATCAGRCDVNRTCASDGDCASGVCHATTLRCVPSRCFDGARNGSETDVDCGGQCDARCAFNHQCVTGLDCQSGSCSASSRCGADQCSDGRLNGNETAIDCGGQCATKCGIGSSCLTGADCVHPQGLVGVSGFCTLGTQACASTSCATGVKDGDETDIDCGGACSTCALGKGCASNADCASSICHVSRHTCSASQRDDGIKNGTETDIDCGGGAAPACGTGLGCVDPMDCASGYCSTSGLCLPSYPRSCASLPNGLGTIDPDGPRQLITDGSGKAIGAYQPFTTWCDNGWTPVMYQNSQGSLAMFGYSPGSMMRSPAPGGYDPMGGSCSSDSECTASDPTIHCRQLWTRGACQTQPCACFSDAVWPDSLAPPGLATAPANLSVSQANQRNLYYFSYELAATGTRYTAMPRRGWNEGNNGGPQRFRWTAYRNGVQVFDSGLFSAYDLWWNWTTGYESVGGQQYASFRRGASAGLPGIADNSTLSWCQTSTLRNPSALPQPFSWWRDGTGTYSNTTLPPYPESDVSSGSAPTVNRCLDIGQSPVGGQYVSGARQQLSTAYAISSVTFARPQPVPSAFDSAKGYVGLWTGYYGMSSGGCTTGPCNTPSAAPRLGAYMGLCNGLANSANQSLSCMGMHHFNGESFQWWNNRNELDLSAAESGTVMEEGVPGLVFVLWAK